MENIQILDLGGSIVAPDQVDTEFIKEFKTFLVNWLDEDESRKAILIIGGGGAARKYQTAYRDIDNNPTDEEQDWIGIAATRLNGQLLKGVFKDYCFDDVIINPETEGSFKGRVMVAAGWKPGFSTDYDSVVLAKRFGAKTVLSLSNIAKIYTDDPKTNPNAEPVDNMTWDEYKKLCGNEWTPGKNIPFDPVATKLAAELGLTVKAAAGKDLYNLKKIFDGKDFFGTTIS
ncbi:UMP kinase [Thiospirochaeta perfilievii]|uniref:Uridylate kinase n=1 Tax=Thiospirochaeta perfilievii TaxID=252967 RepID=A0A5C1QFL0_9SPIO|nr:UMP kinase [Thiospirochaeta perfilievii]QEN05376.1 UMP kinase [Thiospirochaeta perfilievii]